MTRIERENVTVPVVVRSVGGDVRIKGRGGTALIVDGDGVQIEQIGPDQPLVIQSAGDCRMSVPDATSISVQSVGGDAKLTDLAGPGVGQSVGGDLILRNVRDARVANVGGNLRLKWAEGNISIENIGSDATIREIEGSVLVANVGADLYLRNIAGNCVIEQVGSDLVLNLAFVPGQDYRFSAGGDILCRVPPNTSARFVVPLHTELELDIEADVVETDEGQVITVGAGEALVSLHTGPHSTLRLVGEEEDYTINLGMQIEEELDARLSSLEERISAQLEGLDERIQSNAEQWVRQAERMAERAQRQAERAVEHVRERIERRGPKKKRHEFTFGWNLPPRPQAPGRPPKPPKPPVPVEPVTEQERMMILRMVQEGKITIEEAERLLAALDS